MATEPTDKQHEECVRFAETYAHVKAELTKANAERDALIKDRNEWRASAAGYGTDAEILREDLREANERAKKLAGLLTSTQALIGNGHVCESRPHTSEDCGRCFSCCCGQLRKGIDAALAEGDNDE